MFQYSIFDYITNIFTFFKLTTQPRQYLAAWGMFLDSTQKKVTEVFTNRLSTESTDPTAILDEFGLPNDVVLAKAKWKYAELKGTKQGIFELMHALGHDSVSIYNYNDTGLLRRWDSPYGLSDIYGDAPNTLQPRYDSAVFTPFLSDSTTDDGKIKSKYNYYTVVVWDGKVDYSHYTGMRKYGGEDGDSTSLQYHHNDDNGYYLGTTNQDVLKDVCRWGAGINGFCIELIIGYPNVGYSEIIPGNTACYLTIDEYGEPTAGFADANMERIIVDLYV